MALTDQMVAGAHPRRLERPHDPPPFAPTPALLDVPRTHRSVRRPSRGRASPTHFHSRPRRFLAPDEASPVATDCLDLGCSCSSGCNTNPWVHVRLPGSVVFRSPMRRGFALTPIVTLPLSPYGALHPPCRLATFQSIEVACQSTSHFRLTDMTSLPHNARIKFGAVNRSQARESSAAQVCTRLIPPDCEHTPTHPPSLAKVMIIASRKRLLTAP